MTSPTLRAEFLYFAINTPATHQKTEYLPNATHISKSRTAQSSKTDKEILPSKNKIHTPLPNHTREISYFDSKRKQIHLHYINNTRNKTRSPDAKKHPRPTTNFAIYTATAQPAHFPHTLKKTRPLRERTHPSNQRQNSNITLKRNQPPPPPCANNARLPLLRVYVAGDYTAGSQQLTKWE